VCACKGDWTGFYCSRKHILEIYQLCTQFIYFHGF